MDKIEYSISKMEYETVKYGKRYGYWWKQYKIAASKIKKLQNGVDYFYDMEYKLDKPMSYKHFKRWLRIK